MGVKSAFRSVVILNYGSDLRISSLVDHPGVALPGTVYEWEE